MRIRIRVRVRVRVRGRGRGRGRFRGRVRVWVRVGCAPAGKSPGERSNLRWTVRMHSVKLC